MFAACEIGMGVLKGINLNYTPQQLQTDAILLSAILIIETIRVYFGRKGSLSDHGKYRPLTHHIIYTTNNLLIFSFCYDLSFY